MGSKHSSHYNKTVAKNNETLDKTGISNGVINEHLCRKKCILFPNFGASTFVRQVMNQSIPNEELNFRIEECCSLILERLQHFDDLASIDEEFAQLKDKYPFRIPNAREMLTRMWKLDEFRRIVLENLTEVTNRIENLEIFMKYLLDGKFDNRSENPQKYISNRTTGVIETIFTSQNNEIALYEMGGGRNEWKKGLFLFKDTDFILLFYGLSDFGNDFVDFSYVIGKYSYIVASETLRNNPKCRIILIFTKPDILKKKLRRGIVYELENQYEMLDELKCISDSNERNFVNSFVNSFISVHKTEFHIVNLISNEEVQQLKERILSGPSSAFISTCLKEEKGHTFRHGLLRNANHLFFTDLRLGFTE